MEPLKYSGQGGEGVLTLSTAGRNSAVLAFLHQPKCSNLDTGPKLETGSKLGSGSVLMLCWKLGPEGDAQVYLALSAISRFCSLVSKLVQNCPPSFSMMATASKISINSGSSGWPDTGKGQDDWDSTFYNKTLQSTIVWIILFLGRIFVSNIEGQVICGEIAMRNFTRLWFYEIAISNLVVCVLKI
jgi:hypothetical protein